MTREKFSREERRERRVNVNFIGVELYIFQDSSPTNSLTESWDKYPSWNITTRSKSYGKMVCTNSREETSSRKSPPTTTPLVYHRRPVPYARATTLGKVQSLLQLFHFQISFIFIFERVQSRVNYLASCKNSVTFMVFYDKYNRVISFC